MSVQSDITRIESAKTAIATAIEGKGVAVPEGTKLDGLAALVESIEAGGGSVDIKSGTFTPATDPTYGYTVTHDLGKIPILVAVIVGENFTGEPADRVVCLIACDQIEMNTYARLYAYDIKTSDKYAPTTSAAGNIRNATETTFAIANSCVLKALTYKWIVVG